MIEKIYSAARSFIGNNDYKLNNVFIFDWESDLFCVTKSGYSIEIEVKVSRSDFLADFKKPKHDLLIAAFEKKKYVMHDKKVMDHYSQPGCYFKYSVTAEITPNRFFFAVPENLISELEVPSYAGLMYVDDHGRYTIIKNAPLLHKNKIDFQKRLLSKFYHRRNSALNEASIALSNIKNAHDDTNIKGIATYSLGLIKRILQ